VRRPDVRFQGRSGLPLRQDWRVAGEYARGLQRVAGSGAAFLGADPRFARGMGGRGLREGDRFGRAFGLAEGV